MNDRPGAGPGRLAAAIVVSSGLLGCSPTEPSWPAITGAYGSQTNRSDNAPATFDITLRRVDGTRRVNTTGLIIVASQSASRWSGELARRGYPAGEMTGDVGRDGAITFTLAQPRWDDCVTADTLSYAGLARSGTFNATGRGTLRRADGTTLEVEESMHGVLPEPSDPTL